MDTAVNELAVLLARKIYQDIFTAFLQKEITGTFIKRKDDATVTPDVEAPSFYELRETIYKTLVENMKSFYATLNHQDVLNRNIPKEYRQEVLNNYIEKTGIDLAQKIIKDEEITSTVDYIDQFSFYEKHFFQIVVLKKEKIKKENKCQKNH